MHIDQREEFKDVTWSVSQSNKKVILAQTNRRKWDGGRWTTVLSEPIYTCSSWKECKLLVKKHAKRLQLQDMLLRKSKPKQHDGMLDAVTFFKSSINLFGVPVLKNNAVAVMKVGA